MLCYICAPRYVSASYMAIVIALVALSYSLLYIHAGTKEILRNHFFSNSNLFLLMYFVVCFQFPIDYIIGNDGINYSNYFYNLRTINLSVTFDAMCFVSFIIGLMSRNFKETGFYNVPEVSFVSPKIVLRLLIVFWLGFIIFLNKDYVMGGHGSVLINPISVAFYGYFWRLNIVYLAICLHNNKGIKLGLKGALMTLPLLYLLIVGIAVLLFLLANNRVYVFNLLTPCLFYLLCITHFKSKPIPSMILIGIASVFFTLFKIFGLENLFSISNLQVHDLQGYDRFASFSPFTSELAGSILADSALFDVWYNHGVVTLGSTLVLGVLRSISGLVPIFFYITGLSSSTYDTGVYITKLLSADYGLGSSVSGDLILSVGFLGTLACMFFFGKLCFYGDSILRTNRNNLKGTVIALCISSQVLFVARASLCDLIAAILFNILFLKIYMNIVSH